MTISWFLWKGEIFRVPLSSLQRPKEGGWGLINPAAKCMALFMNRMRTMHEEGDGDGRLDGEVGTIRTKNPPYAKRTPT